MLMMSMFPRCPPRQSEPAKCYNRMDGVIMCSDWDPDPSNILESDQIFHAKLHNYIITISKLDAVWLPHSQDGCCSLGKSSLKSRSAGLTAAVIYFHHKHSVSWSFLLVTDTVYRAEMWQRVGRTGRRTGRRTDRRTDASILTAVVFVFPPSRTTLRSGVCRWVSLSRCWEQLEWRSASRCVSPWT